VTYSNSNNVLSSDRKVKSQGEGDQRWVTTNEFGLSSFKLISYVICGVGKRLQAGGIVPQLI
ncbi:hypothetical protein, partial [Erwinia sp. MYb416]|uniref:hypothetical protein n=1 Tax=Erwinia sp. MYb416 TaxID=3108532 RepID=UPI00309BB297